MSTNIIPIKSNYRSVMNIKFEEYAIQYTAAIFIAKLMDKVNQAVISGEREKAEILDEVLEMALKDLKVKVIDTNKEEETTNDMANYSFSL